MLRPFTDFAGNSINDNDDDMGDLVASFEVLSLGDMGRDIIYVSVKKKSAILSLFLNSPHFL
jgi:hypothetical protein